MVTIKLINIKYYIKKYKLTDITAVTEGIEFIIERADSTVYSRKYELQTDISNILLERQRNIFMYNIISMYHMFVSEKSLDIKAETVEELSLKLKSNFNI